jgi:alpha-beta hydrolase superfamily lysophospholipase
VTSRHPALCAATCLLVWALFLHDAPLAAAAGRSVTLPAADGVTIAGQLYEAASRPSPGVVLVHMLSRTRSDWDEVARQLEAAGVTVLAIDLRGHGASGGSAARLSDMVPDVRAAVQWLSSRPTVRVDAIGVVGASLGANLALLAAAGQPQIRVVAAISPSLDYRGLRVGPDVMQKLSGRGVWLAASSEDPFALRTLKDLTADVSMPRDQQLSSVAAHGTSLLAADKDLARALVDWLRQRLLF